jgi:hypothetical protein
MQMNRYVLSTTAMLLAMALLGCSWIATTQPAPTATLPTPTATPTSMPAAEPAATAPPPATPTVPPATVPLPTATALPTQEPTSAPSPDPAGGQGPSPLYGIYVGMTQQGFCGPTTNSGWFSSFDFDAAFQNVRLVPPGPENPFPNGGFMTSDSFMALPVVMGEGTVGSYSICPDYDAEANPNSVTAGPNPFEPSLMFLMEEDMPPVPLTGDAGPQVSIRFDMGSARDGGSIMDWESRLAKGVLGAPFDRFGVLFVVGWNSVMAGEEFEVRAEYQDEGEVQAWTMRFVPLD